MCALRAFYAFLMDEEIATENPADVVHVRFRPHVRTEVYSEAEVEQILSWARAEDCIRWQVGFVLLSVFRFTGSRLSELLGLRLEDVETWTRVDSTSSERVTRNR